LYFDINVVNGIYVVADSNIIATNDDTTASNVVSCSGTPLSCSAKSISTLKDSDFGYYLNANNIAMIINCVHLTETEDSPKCTVTDDITTGYLKTVNSECILRGGLGFYIAPTMTCSSHSIVSIGHLDTTTNKLCLDGTKMAGFTVNSTPTNYLVHYYRENIFLFNYFDKPIQYEKVKATENSLCFNRYADTPYCVNNNTLVATTLDANSNCATTETKYDCKKDNYDTCTLVAGIYSIHNLNYY